MVLFKNEQVMTQVAANKPFHQKSRITGNES